MRQKRRMNYEMQAWKKREKRNEKSGCAMENSDEETKRKDG